MNYAEIVKDTDDMLRRVMLRNSIETALLIGFCAILIILMIAMLWSDHRERKARKVQRVVGGYQFRPTVTDEVQVINGEVFHRMGVPGKEV